MLKSPFKSMSDSEYTAMVATSEKRFSADKKSYDNFCVGQGRSRNRQKIAEYQEKVRNGTMQPYPRPSCR